MAENKRSFVLYADLIHTVKKLPKVKAGELFMTILEYVNDLNPNVNDMVIDLVFEPIKQQLKRDLKHWEGVKEERSKSGKLGGIKSGKVRLKQKEAKEANALKSKQNEANEAVNVNVNVSDIDERTSSSLFTLKMLSNISFGVNEFTRYACSQTKRTIEQLPDLLTKFVTEQKALTKLSWQSEKDAKSHFINWVKKQPATMVKPLHLQRIQ